MSIFTTDDDDDELVLDERTRPPAQNNSPSLPSRPAPQRATPSAPSRPAPNFAVPSNRPTSPFGGQPEPKPAAQQPPRSGNAIPPRRPTNPVTPATPIQQAPALPSRVTPPPPATATFPPLSKTPPASRILPPKQEETPVAPVQQTPEVAPTDDQVLSEAELYLRRVKEEAEDRRREAALKQADSQREPEPVPTRVAPAPVKQEEPEPLPVVEPQSKGIKKGKKAKKEKKSLDPKPVSKYAGERNKILYLRLGAAAVAAIIAVAGFQAIFLPDRGPTKEMVMDAAQESVNYTGFPAASGEQFAIDFAKAYFNFNSSDTERKTSLERFASPDLIAEIDIKLMAQNEYELTANNGQPYSDYKVQQGITYGPYVVAINNISEEHSVFTVKVGLGENVIYLDVPVKYDPENYALTLAGPPSFSKPIQNKGEASKTEWTSSFANGGDTDIQKSFANDLDAYLSAWALSDSTIINRYVLDNATDNAKRGLQNAVVFNSVASFAVEAADEERPQTATQRRVEIKVIWEDPNTNLRYPQQYRMLIGLNQEGKWAVYDIENFAVLN